MPIDVRIPEAFGFLFDPPLGTLRYRAAWGGRGSGRSWSFARALLLHAAQRPLRVLCVREYQSSIRDSVHRLLSDQIPALGLDACYEIQRDGIFGTNGSEFRFKGLVHDINEIKSTEGVDICWLEEAQSASRDSWEVLVPTIRKTGSEIWACFNTGMESDPTYQRLVVTPPARSIVRKVSYRDNPFATAELLEEARELQRRDPEAYAHIWEGEAWHRSDADILSSRLRMEEFTPADHWAGPYYGADWGFARDPSSFTRVWIADRRLYLDYEEGGVQLDFDETERRFRRIPGAADHVIRADNARPETIHEMTRRGLRVQAADKWPGSVKDGIEHLRSYEQIVLHPRCERAWRELRLYRYKTDKRTGDVLPDVVDAHNHVSDSVRYALDPLIRQRPFSTVKVRYA